MQKVPYIYFCSVMMLYEEKGAHNSVLRNNSSIGHASFTCGVHFSVMSTVHLVASTPDNPVRLIIVLQLGS